ncbi:hypothetical protein K3N28_22390 [Glycomyces sp. TRM65418]|uniref:hypothetical protein n=1 Tax=Glycomyces sp. TRM65418 TaxID=2867006 RepID=UPI001CE62BC1|nr:hypothetical protein [Glycomyces sp. TRM65418]MCC3765812.1 hypothetical protein [Glycomyces sp. TRM65418]QZD55398.1 hypothetical protein K3N28_22270 [Glycomyces sp. TRM65418]
MRALPVLTSLVLLAGLTACGGEAEDLLRPRPTGCYFAAEEGRVHLSAEQAANAATIAAVGHREGMDEHAVAVAITTAMQESELVNVDYGHDDSLGLFQQRPSMGWGTEDELMDPVYAAFKFYEKLQRTDGWRDMTLAEASQAVQISAYPDLYKQWETDATVIAAVLAGGEESGLACVSGKADEVATDAAALAEAHEYHWGAEVSQVDGATVVIAAEDAAQGWNRAAWAVARAWDHGIATVEYGGKVWSPGEDAWTEPEPESTDGGRGAADTSAVVVTFAAGE